MLNHWKDIESVYLIGIKGVGMTGLAQHLKALQKRVSGSDTSDTFMTDAILQKEKIPVFESFSEKNLRQAAPDLIVFSTAYNAENNPEIAYAQRKNLPLVSYPEMVAFLFNANQGIAVCGTHGKTTTSAMLAYVLKNCGQDPKALIGGVVPQFGGNALLGKSDLFVLEADEYQYKLRLYEPRSAILTNIDWDHPDVFKTPEDYLREFSDFVNKIPAKGILVACGEDKNVKRAVKKSKCQILFYGFSSNNDYYLKNKPFKNQKPCFEVFYKQKKLGEVKLSLYGEHNTLNALSVIALGHQMGLDFSRMAVALASFQGTERRFQKKGTYNKALIMDDYAHHPKEISGTLQTLRKIYPRKILISLFQPHTFSRTESLFADFVDSLEKADRIWILDIYASAREKKGAARAQDLVEALREKGRNAVYVRSFEQALQKAKKVLNEKHVFITLGAGDVWKIADQLVK